MAVSDSNRGTTADVDGPDGKRCSCLPFCFWGSRRTKSGGGAPGKRRRRLRFRLRLSWFSWPWLRKSGKKGDSAETGKKRRARRLLLLLKTSLQAKKALASVVSGDSSSLIPAKVSSFGDAMKQNKSTARRAAGGAAPGGTRQPQASMTARPGTNQRRTTTTDEPALAGRIWRAPSRHHSLQPDLVERPAGASGLWTATTTLGVIVLFGRVTAVVFLLSCLYGARFVRARATGASAGGKSSGIAGASCSRRFGDSIGVAAEKDAESCTAEDLKKKVLMAGLLDRSGMRPSSRFGR